MIIAINFIAMLVGLKIYPLHPLMVRFRHEKGTPTEWILVDMGITLTTVFDSRINRTYIRL